MSNLGNSAGAPYGGTLGGLSSVGSTAVDNASGSIDLSGLSANKLYQVFARIGAADSPVFINDTAATGGKTIAPPTTDEEGSVFIGAYVGGTEIPVRCSGANTATLSWTAEQIVR